MNNTTLFSSVVPLRPQTLGPGLCRSVFSRPVCPYAIVTFDPVTRDVTILPGAVPAGAARPAHSLGEGDDRGGEGQPRTHLMVGRTFSACRFKEWTESRPYNIRLGEVYVIIAALDSGIILYFFLVVN